NTIISLIFFTIVFVSYFLWFLLKTRNKDISLFKIFSTILLFIVPFFFFIYLLSLLFSTEYSQYRGILEYTNSEQLYVQVKSRLEERKELEEIEKLKKLTKSVVKSLDREDIKRFFEEQKL